MSTADDSLRFCDMFEGELLLELMLRFWKHPLSSDTEFRNDLIEKAAEILKASQEGQHLLENMPPSQMNFVAAVWYAEWTTLQTPSPDISKEDFRDRNEWLNAIRNSIPSCFCDQNNLSE